MKAESRAEKWSGRWGGEWKRHTTHRHAKGELGTLLLDLISPKIPFSVRTLEAFVFMAPDSLAEMGKRWQEVAEMGKRW